MPKIANVFGRILGPQGKDAKSKGRLHSASKGFSQAPVRQASEYACAVTAKTVPVMQCRIGTEAMTDEELARNFSAVYDQLLSLLPNGEANVKAAFFKLTMGRPVRAEMTYKAKAARYKVDEVKALLELINEYPVIGLLNVENLPSQQLQVLRSKLRKNLLIRVSKKEFIRRAIEQAKDKKEL